MKNTRKSRTFENTSLKALTNPLAPNPSFDFKLIKLYKLVEKQNPKATKVSNPPHHNSPSKWLLFHLFGSHTNRIQGYKLFMQAIDLQQSGEAMDSSAGANHPVERLLQGFDPTVYVDYWNLQEPPKRQPARWKKLETLALLRISRLYCSIHLGSLIGIGNSGIIFS